MDKGLILETRECGNKCCEHSFACFLNFALNEGLERNTKVFNDIQSSKARAEEFQECKLMLIHQSIQRPCGLMDKALVFGTKDCRFESCQGHFWSFRIYSLRDRTYNQSNLLRSSQAQHKLWTFIQPSECVLTKESRGPVAKWIRHWFSEAKIAGSSPVRVIFVVFEVILWRTRHTILASY